MILSVILTHLLFLSASFAAENLPLQLNFSEALKIAAEKNPSVIMADERVKQALERFYQTRASFFPQISSSVSETRQTKNLETMGLKPVGNSPSVVGPFNAFDARLKLTQTLFDWALVKRLEAAGASHDLSKAEQKKVKEDVLALVATLYVEAERAKDAVSFAKVTLKLCQEKYRLAHTQFKLGTGSEMDLKEAIADLSASRFEWRTAMTRAHDKRLDLKIALGFSEAQILELQDQGLFLGNTLPKRSELLNAAKKHPATNVANEALRVSRAEAAAEKAEVLPKISGVADYGASANQPADSKESYSYGLQLSWPLFEGGRRGARIAESASKSREAQTNFNDIQNQNESRALEAKEALKNARVFIRAKGDRYEFYRLQLELTKRRFENGSASELGVLQAMAEETQAKDEQKEAFAAYRMAQVSLAHALGQMGQLMESMEQK